MVKYGTAVTIQAVGLNYSSGHKFSSKAVLSLGVPYTIPKKLADFCFKDKKEAVSCYSADQHRMTEVWVTAPSRLLVAWSLYKPDSCAEDARVDIGG